jgi:hypothetical protein
MSGITMIMMLQHAWVYHVVFDLSLFVPLASLELSELKVHPTDRWDALHPGLGDNLGVNGVRWSGLGKGTSVLQRFLLHT